MNTFLKWVLAGVGIVVVIFVLAAVVLPMAVDPNNYKEEIRAAVLEETGRELSIGGEIQWTVFPWIGLGLSDLQLGNRAGFGDQPMFSVGEASVAVKLMPLFSRKLEIGKLSLSDVSVYLQQKANGQNNWDDLSGSQSNSTNTTAASDGGLEAWVVSGIEISNANVTLDEAGQITELKGFGLKVSNIELGRPFDLEGGFSINVVKSQLSGEVKFGGLVQSAANGTGYGIEGFDLSFKGQQGAAGQALSLDVAINANADIDLSNDQATLSDFALRFHELLLNGQLDVSSLTNAPRFAGQLKLAEFNPRSFLKALGVEAPRTADENALTSLQAEMSFAGSSNSANMQNLTLKFDKSIFEGHLKVDNFEQPRLAFDFQIDRLNLDDYLPETAVETDQSDLTVDVFRGFTGGGDFRIGQLIVAGLAATDVSLTMSSDGHGIRLFPISAQVYGGQYQGDIKIDASGSRPILTTSQALSGDIGMNFRDGAIVGINVAETIRKAKAALGQQADSAGVTERDPKTDFTELSMTGRIEQGILTSDDLMMQSPLLRVTGKGTANLVEETINYVVKPILVGSLEGQGGQGLAELSGIPIPVKLTGNLYEPDIAVDIVAAIAGSQKAKINAKKDELIGQLLGGKDASDTTNKEAGAKEKDDPAKTLLKGLFGSKKDQKKDDGGVP